MFCPWDQNVSIILDHIQSVQRNFIYNPFMLKVVNKTQLKGILSEYKL